MGREKCLNSSLTKAKMLPVATAEKQTPRTVWKPAKESGHDMKTPPSPNGPNGRDAKGRFSKGNRGGPGNPHARQKALTEVARVLGIITERRLNLNMNMELGDLTEDELRRQAHAMRIPKLPCEEERANNDAVLLVRDIHQRPRGREFLRLCRRISDRLPKASSDSVAGSGMAKASLPYSTERNGVAVRFLRLITYKVLSPQP